MCIFGVNDIGNLNTYTHAHVLHIVIFSCLQILAIIGFVLNGANVYGYVMCRRDAGIRLSSMATTYIGKKVLEQVHLWSCVPEMFARLEIRLGVRLLVVCFVCILTDGLLMERFIV